MWDIIASIGEALPTIAKIAEPVLQIGGTILSNQANKSAAKTVKEGELEAARLANEATDKQIAAVKQGIAEGDVIYGNIREQTQPGVSYLRNIIAAPTSLTPEQLAERDELRRRVTDSSQVGGSGLRGSGRSFVNAMREVENDYTLRSLAANRDRADRAALQFSTPYFNAWGSQAGAHATLGRDVGGALARQGETSAAATREGAYTGAQSGLANAQNWGNTIGEIAGTISDWKKDQARPTKYTAPIVQGEWDKTPSYDPIGNMG